MRKGEWAFLSNHGRVLAYIAEHPQATAQEIAQEASLSIRAVQNIIINLEKGGYVVRQKEGRRNHYTVYPNKPMRHRLEKGHPVGNVLTAVGCNLRKTTVKQKAAGIERPDEEAKANAMR